MPDTGVQSITGDGEFLLAGSTLMLGLLYWVDTTTIKVEVLSDTFPAKILHAGWIGLASGITGVGGSTLSNADLQMSWWSFFEFMSTKKIFDSTSDPNTDRIVWHLGPGVAASFQGFY